MLAILPRTQPTPQTATPARTSRMDWCMPPMILHGCRSAQRRRGATVTECASAGPLAVFGDNQCGEKSIIGSAGALGTCSLR